MDKIAVLIPCYNESKTIDKVVRDFKKALPEATIYVIIRKMVRIKLQKMREQLLDMSINREREMLSEECFQKLMQNVI